MTVCRYEQRLTEFHSEAGGPARPVLLFIATPRSQYWLGPAADWEIAQQVGPGNSVDR